MYELYGSLRNAGVNGYLWTSTAHASALQAYYLHFNNVNIYPSYYDTRWLGFAVWMFGHIFGKHDVL